MTINQNEIDTIKKGVDLVPFHHLSCTFQTVIPSFIVITHILLRALIFRRVKTAGLRLSMRRILNELDAIREVVNIYPKKRGQKKEKMQATLSKLSDLQRQLMSILQLSQDEDSVLG